MSKTMTLAEHRAIRRIARRNGRFEDTHKRDAPAPRKKDGTLAVILRYSLDRHHQK